MEHNLKSGFYSNKKSENAFSSGIKKVIYHPKYFEEFVFVYYCYLLFIQNQQT